MPTDDPLRLETKNFIGWPMEQGHVSHLRSLYTDPLVMKTLSGDGAPFSDEAINIIATRLVSHWDAHGIGPYVFLRRDDESFVGYAGLRHTLARGKSEVELLYAVRSDAWGRGVGTEMARVVVEQGFAVLGLSELVSMTLPDNAGSRRVLEKLGFANDGEGDYGGVAHVFFRLRSPSKKS